MKLLQLIFPHLFFFGVTLSETTTEFLPDLAKAEHRIVGGVNASIYEFSYQVSVQVYQQHICGGAILTNTYILTAAHCVTKQKPRATTIRVGSNYTRQGGLAANVCKFIIHKLYNTTTMDNDIALLMLCETLNFSKAVTPIPLPPTDLILQPGTLVTVSGWGYEKEEGKLSVSLKRVEVPIVPLNVCRNKYRYISLVTEYHICAGYTTGGKDACQGDSGGPLVVNGTIIGVVSYGIGCATAYPGVYTNVARYLDWIYTNANLTNVQPGEHANEADTSKPWYDNVFSWVTGAANRNTLTSFYVIFILFSVSSLMK